MPQRASLFCFIAALALIAVPAQAQVVLKWKLAKGDVFEVVTETTVTSATTSTDQVGNTSKEEETETETSSRRVEVTDVTADGNYKMVITINSIEKNAKSSERIVTFTAKKDAEGKKSVSVNIKANNPLLQGDDVKALMEKLASNMLDFRIMFEVTPMGVVVAATHEGDPFFDLPEDTKVTKMIAGTARRMLNPDDLPQMAAAQTFTQLPDKAVDITADWPLRRAFTVMGLTMEGKGKTTLTKVENTDGGTVATLSEKLVYKVDAARFNKLLAELMESIFADAGLPVQLNVNLKATKDITADATTLFNIDKGHATTTTWSGLTVPFGGAMTINIPGQQNTVNMEMQVTMATKNTWTRK